MSVTINEVCKEYQISRPTLWRWRKRNLIQAPDTGGGAHAKWLTMPVKNQSNQSTSPSS